MRILPLLIIIAVPTMGHAVENEVNVLSVGISSLPAMKKAKQEITVAGLPFSNDVALEGDSGGLIEASFSTLRFKDANTLGFAVMAGVLAGGVSAEDQLHTEASVDLVGVQGGFDFALRMHDAPLYATAGPRIGLGVSSQSIDLPEYHDGRGHFFSLGVEVGGYAKLNRWVLGVGVGTMAWKSNARQRYQDGTVDEQMEVTLRGRGGYGQITTGITF